MATLSKNPETGVYYYRRSIPKNLRPLFAGKWEWKRSLRTKDKAVARARQPAMADLCEKEFAAARTGQEPHVVGTLSDRDVLALAARWLNGQLKAREHDLGTEEEWDGWGAMLHDAAPSNPIDGLKVEGLSRKKREGTSRSLFTPAEALALLSAARSQEGAYRWIPWVLAATGCRLREVCQAFKCDIQREHGIDFLAVTRRGKQQALKNSHSERRVPLHPALVQEGFLKYVEALPEGARLFPDLQADRDGDWSAEFGRRHGEWVRTFVSDMAKAPAHSWRHGFKTAAVDAGILASVSDTLTGHGAGLARRERGEGPRYEHMLLQTLADAVAKIDFGAPPPVEMM